ncbi:hypothetical protein BBJ28_00008318 [Nothophytophthora sp. Chile5]|nr:hypothetical protein BBJ28_00008318 [Nothophytophthora sp. Chile5]
MAVAAAAAVVSLAVASIAGGIALKVSDSGKAGFGGELYFNGRDVKLPIGYIQRCYTFTETWSKPANNAMWKDFPDLQGQIAFFEDDDCKGKNVVTRSSTKGSIDFKGTALHRKEISSVIIWSYSAYPVQGLVHVNRESTQLRAVEDTLELNSTSDCYNTYGNSSWDGDTEAGCAAPLNETCQDPK